MDSPSPPPAPDPYATADAQGKANVSAAQTTTALNRPNQITPYGSLTWTHGSQGAFDENAYDQAVAQAKAAAGGVGGGYSNPADGNWIEGPMHASGSTGAMPDRNDPRFYSGGSGDPNQWTSTVTLDPRVQALVDSQLATSQGLNGSIQNALTHVNGMLDKPYDPTEARSRAEAAMMDKYRSRLDPQYQQQEQAMRSDLMNRGLTEGSQAWTTQMDQFGRQKNDAYQQAQDSSILNGGQQVAQDLAMRNQTINELASLRSGQQVQMPQFQSGMSGANVNPAPIAQSIANNYQAEMGQYNANVGSQNSMMSGLMSLGGSAMMAPAGTFAGIPAFLGAAMI